MNVPALSLTDLIAIGTIIGGVIAAINALIHVGDRLWGSKKKDEAATQSEACSRDHSSVHAILVQQNANTSELIKALRDHIHAEELRHQIVISKLDRISDALPRYNHHSDAA